MTYGNLGEHSELTALKGAGISLTRTLIPMFFFSILLTITAYLSNNYIVPKANLKAYSLLYDIKHKSPALNIKEGVFYNNIPGYQIKVNKKFSDGRSLKDVIIYNHTKRTGNTEITLADSGQMYTIRNDRYLVMELFNGHHYSEQEIKPNRRVRRNTQKPSPFARNKFDHSKFVFSMASFDLKRTKEELFAGNRLMKGVKQLKYDVDSLEKDIKFAKHEAFNNLKNKFDYHLDDLVEPEELFPENYGREPKRDTTNKHPQYQETQKPSNRTAFTKAVSVPEKKDSIISKTNIKDKNIPAKRNNTNQKMKLYAKAAGDTPIIQTRQGEKKEDSLKIQVSQFIYSRDGPDSLLNGEFKNTRYLTSAVTNARFVKNHIMVTTSKLSVKNVELLRFKIQRYKIFAQAFSCLIMFLIGAPLGSIIKRGGFGFPVIVSIGFFIIYYVFMSIGEKWAKEELVTPFFGIWLANFVLLPFGLFFLRQARLDARLFDVDFYNVFIEKVKSRIPEKYKKRMRFVLFNR
jgi:lipopolysaccharide export system permease protein